MLRPETRLARTAIAHQTVALIMCFLLTASGALHAEPDRRAQAERVQELARAGADHSLRQAEKNRDLAQEHSEKGEKSEADKEREHEQTMLALAVGMLGIGAAAGIAAAAVSSGGGKVTPAVLPPYVPPPRTSLVPLPSAAAARHSEGISLTRALYELAKARAAQNQEAQLRWILSGRTGQ